MTNRKQGLKCRRYI